MCAAGRARGFAAWLGFVRSEVQRASMFLGPAHDLLKDGLQGAGRTRQLVFHARRDFWIDRAFDEAVPLQIAKLGGPHVLGDGGNGPSQCR